jgi:hypothetical protein
VDPYVDARALVALDLSEDFDLLDKVLDPYS